MSVGPAALGNVLVQRLDAVLGTTMSAASANQVSGARPDAVAQPGNIEKPGQSDGSARDPRQGGQAGAARGDRPAAPLVDAKTAAALALAARGVVTSSDSTASAPTTLGRTARAILSLLAQYPGAAPAVQGRAPLWNAGAPAEGAAPPPQADAGAQARPAGTPPGQILPGAASAGGPAAAGAAAASHPASPLVQPAPAAASVPTHPAALSGPAGTQQAQAAGARAPAAAMLAQALRQALQGSGLFYESHLTDLAFGKRNLAELQEAPQARLSRDGIAREPLPLPGRDTAGARAAEGAGPSAGQAQTPSPGAPVPGIHQDLNTLVRQQLDVLANQTIAWQGEAWPGTPMEWEVQRDPYGGDPESAAPAWATRLKLDLPRLGLVDARLNLSGDQLVLQVVAPLAAGEISTSSDELRARLLAAGLTLSHLAVHVADPRPVLDPDLA